MLSKLDLVKSWAERPLGGLQGAAFVSRAWGLRPSALALRHPAGVPAHQTHVREGLSSWGNASGVPFTLLNGMVVVLSVKRGGKGHPCRARPFGIPLCGFPVSQTLTGVGNPELI